MENLICIAIHNIIQIQQLVMVGWPTTCGGRDLKTQFYPTGLPSVTFAGH